jgi:diaminohydroxyphosphoribosylaminopyrimidine deaminase/5-amino-6-(5-phosphoribosylamino)uracil reductase
VAWNLPFFAELFYKRPLIVGKWAQTLNGQMADQEGGSQWISGPLARRYGHWLRQKYDAILVGAGTALADGPELTARDTWGPLRQPLKIVFDPSGRLATQRAEDLPAKVRNRTFATQTKVVLVCPTNVRDQSWAKPLGADVYYVPVKSRDEAFSSLLDAVTSADFVAWHGAALQSIFIEGGPALHNHLLAHDFYDAFHVFVTPSLISANVHRVGFFPDQKVPAGHSRIASMKRYQLLQSLSLGPDILLEFMPEDRIEHIFS